MGGGGTRGTLPILRGSHFFVRKLHSLTGVVPVGAFVVLHLWGNSFAALGPEAYDTHLDNLRALPYFPLAEVALILLPLVFHAFYGVVVTFEARNNLDRYSFPRNWHFWFQRVTGLVALAFILYHVSTFRLNELLGAPAASYEKVATALSNPFILAFHLVGVVSVSYHLGNGLWLFGVNWGILAGPRAQRTAANLSWLFTIVLSIIGVNALGAFLP